MNDIYHREPGIYVCLLLKSVPLRDTIGNGGSLSWDEQQRDELKDLVIMGEACSQGGLYYM